jgi:S-adenosyl-L-methionine hydrolase (adenosine-forming)
MNIISLTTDFGVADWFVGTMKGVILRIASRATIVDISHGIASGDIRAGAFALAAAYRYFPRNTIHVAVVDPGVGSGRPAIAVKTADYFFVGPDNGILSLALSREKIKTIRHLENDSFFNRPLSHTFHGRDIFAPVAAHLSRGVSIQKLGPRVNEYVRLNWPVPKRGPGKITGEIIYIDHFGNAITNIDGQSLVTESRTVWDVLTRRKCFGTLQNHYEAVPLHSPAAVVGSTGLLEIAANGGSAAALFGLKIGDSVTVRVRDGAKL